MPDPRERWRALGLLALVTLLGMSSWFSATAVVPQLRDLWGLGAVESAGLTLAVQVGFVVGALTSAVLTLADVVPVRILLLTASLGAAMANLMVLVADGIGLALAARFVTGFFLAGIYPVALKHLATWFREGRGTALGLMVGALTVGSALPHLVNALGSTDWQVVIATTSALTALGGVVGATLVRDGPHPFPSAVFAPRQAGQALRDRGVRLATFGYFGHMWELYAMWAWFVVFAGDSVDSQSASLLTFAVIGIGALGCWLGGVAGDRIGRTTTTAIAMAVSGGCALVIGLVSGGPLWLFVLVSLLWGVAVIADSAQFSTIVTEVADQRYVGTALTLQLAAGFLLTAVTITLVPLARDAWTWQWAFAVLVPGPVLGIVAMLRLRHSPQAALIAGGRG